MKILNNYKFESKYTFAVVGVVNLGLSSLCICFNMSVAVPKGPGILFKSSTLSLGKGRKYFSSMSNWKTDILENKMCTLWSSSA